MKEIYSQIVKEIRSKGVKIRHRRFADNGEYNQETNTITIDRSIRNTLTGCVVLYHEFHHALDFRYNRHRRFYRYDTARLNIPRSEQIKIIWKAEWGCFAYALNRLKRFGIRKRDHYYFKKTWAKKHLLPLWIDIYLDS
jgi:hypothetical protein